MSELTITVIRLALLALLWAFVFSIIGVLRSDLYGTRVVTRRGDSQRRRRPDTRPAQHPRRAKKRGPTQLAVIEGRMRGTTMPLNESGLLIGRNPECSLVLTDDFASGRHLRIYPADDGWYADDLNSTNGTFLDSQRIGQGARLEPGSRVRIGQTVLELRK